MQSGQMTMEKLVKAKYYNGIMMEEKKYIIEIATSDFATTKSAVEGGADRIELCANLAEGGTTPSYGTIKQCREAFNVFVISDHKTKGRRFFIYQR